MGKTSLVRELLRRLGEEGSFETIFVDLDGAVTPADAIAEIGVQSKSAQKIWPWIKSGFANTLREVGDRIDTLELVDVRVKVARRDRCRNLAAERRRGLCGPGKERPACSARDRRTVDPGQSPAQGGQLPHHIRAKAGGGRVSELASQKRPNPSRPDLYDPFRQRRPGTDPSTGRTQRQGEHLFSLRPETLGRGDRRRLPRCAGSDL